MFNRVYSLNFLSRFIFLILTPVFFQYFALGFIWHSIYWGVVTSVLMIWAILILLSPLLGRIGCGWFCFMGTVSDLAGEHAFCKHKQKRPLVWLGVVNLILFLASSVTFYFLNKERGITHGFEIIPDFLPLSMDGHYKTVWVADVSFALILSLFLNKRWGCKNLCFVGRLYSAGSKYSRLIPVVDKDKCTRCGRCEKECLTGISLLDYIGNNGLITSTECILCGKCTETCKPQAIKLRFVWNRSAGRGRGSNT